MSNYLHNLKPAQPKWIINKPRRVGGFRWSLIPENWFPTSGSEDPITAAWTAIIMVASLVEFVLLRPTVGVVRLAIHHSRSPGWYLRVMYTKIIHNGLGDYTVDLQTRTKGEAKRVARVLRRELGRAGNLDFNTPAVQAAIAENRATAAVVSNATPSGTA